MTIKVLIVDDSTFICKLIKRILEEDAEFTIVGFAANGREAIIKTATLEPDVITMDVEMPIMDGITAVKRIMAEMPTPILMFSAMTKVGAKATLDALNAGAVDFLPKQLEDIDGNLENAKQQLRQRVRMVATAASVSRQQRSTSGVNKPAKPGQHERFQQRNHHQINASSPHLQVSSETGSAAQDLRKPVLTSYHATPSALTRMKLLIVVASTGGPVAIQQILMQLPASCPVPVLLVQHMPASFTRSFAERLNSVCKIQVKEAAQGDLFEPGKALLAPGGHQLEIRTGAGKSRVELRSKSASEIYAPCADITLGSVAEHFPGQSLTIVLTGMGADGKEGAVKLKQGGGLVWAQNEASCTIYGMPKAIVDAGLADKIYALDEIANELKRIT